MKYIIAGTNRPQSRSLELSHIIANKYREHQQTTEVISLQNLPLKQMDGSIYSDKQPQALEDLNNKVLSSDGIILVIPEYNGSMPGILKYFIDHMPYPGAFLYRPVCFVGLGGMFGGLRPVEHCQQVFSYRNAYVFPERIFIQNVWTVIKEKQIIDQKIDQKLSQQCLGFSRFIEALKTAKLHANFIEEKTI